MRINLSLARFWAITAAFVCVFFQLHSQHSVVKKISSIPASVSIYDYCPCGSSIFFAGRNEKGIELWKTDGTSSGTVLVKDLNPGYGNGVYDQIKCSNGKVVFTGYNSTYGIELWVSDGTEAGTVLLKDLVPGPGSSWPALMTFGNLVYFILPFGSQGMELWSTDGTPGGTKLVQAVEQSNTSVSILNSGVINGRLYFLLNGLNYQLWTTDGTSTGMQLLRESSWLYECKESDNNLFFVEAEGQNRTIWKTDGTLSGVTKVSDHSSYPQRFFAYDGGFFFYGDGTQYSNGSDSYVNIIDGRLDAGVVYNGLFYGVACNGSECFLFKSDGTPEGTGKVIGLGGNSSETVMWGEIPVLNNKMILGGSDGTHGIEVMISDGTADGTLLLKDVQVGGSGSTPSAFTSHGGRVLFQADDGTRGRELWISDGTTAGTTLLKDVSTGTEPAVSTYPFFALGDQLYFLASSEKYAPQDLWRSNGTSSGTSQFVDFTSYPGYIGQVAESLIFMADKQILRISSDNGGISQLADFSAALGSAYSMGVSSPSFQLGDELIFSMNLTGQNINSGFELWKTDGSPAGTNMIKDIWPGFGNGVIQARPAVLGDKFIFAAQDGISGAEVWISDGTAVGTKILKDIWPGAEGGLRSINFLTFEAFNGAVYFAANDGNGVSLWKTNGTTEGTIKVKEGVPGPSSIVILNNNLIFTAYDKELGWSIWKSDGTASGTLLVSDIGETTEAGYQPYYATVCNGLVYYSANDGVHGNELWITDGTAAGTRMLDLAPGFADSNPRSFFAFDEHLYFSAAGKIWRTKGSTETTEVVADIEARSDMARLGSALYFVGVTAEYGGELVRVDIDAVLGSEENQSIDVTIFPNPANDKIVIKSTQDRTATVRIYDLSGRQLASFMALPHAATEYDVSAYHSGVYLASIQTSKGRIVKRFIKTGAAEGR